MDTVSTTSMPLSLLHAEACVLNWLWDWSLKRARQTGHPYYVVLAQDMQAIVRSYNAPIAQ